MPHSAVFLPRAHITHFKVISVTQGSCYLKLLVTVLEGSCYLSFSYFSTLGPGHVPVAGMHK